MKKNEILKELQNEKARLLKRQSDLLTQNKTDSNLSKLLKQNSYMCEKVEKYLNNELDYTLLGNNKTTSFNYGVLNEIVFKNYLKLNAVKMAVKNEKDISNHNVYTEIKSCINASNMPKTNLNQLNNNKGYIFLLLDNVYKIKSEVIKEHINELRKQNNYIRFSIPFIKKYGVIDYKIKY